MFAENIEVMYDHYKDTNRLIASSIVKRDRYFIFGLLSALATSMLTIDPALTLKIIGEVGKEKLKVSHYPAYHFVNTILLYLSTWFWVRYYQMVIYIEGLYPYVHGLEERLVRDFAVEITREGLTYKEHSSILRRLIRKFYSVLVPIVLVLAASTKILVEWFSESAIIPLSSRIFDSVAVAVLLATTLSYFTWDHFKDFTKK